jgi:hypothetical protein
MKLHFGCVLLVEGEPVQLDPPYERSIDRVQARKQLSRARAAGGAEHADYDLPKKRIRSTATL